MYCLKKSWLQGVRAVVFDFDGTLAVLNIDLSEMREQVFELMREYGVNEEKTLYGPGHRRGDLFPRLTPINGFQYFT